MKYRTPKIQAGGASKTKKNTKKNLGRKRLLTLLLLNRCSVQIWTVGQEGKGRKTVHTVFLCTDKSDRERKGFQKRTEEGSWGGRLRRDTQVLGMDGMSFNGLTYSRLET